MRHPNITQLIHIFREKEKIYMIMEKCEDGELWDLIIDHEV